MILKIVFRFTLFMAFFLLSKVTPEAVEWTGQAPGGFSASVEISRPSISILEELTVNLTLVYPDTYHADIEKLRSHLLRNFGVREAPFSLAAETLLPQEKAGEKITEKAVFKLEPQYPGTHLVSFLNIPFEPNEPNHLPKVEIFSKLLEVNVAMPKEIGPQDLLPAPLMKLSDRFPIDLDANNRLYQKQHHDLPRTLALLRGKEIPWITMLALAAVLIFLIRANRPQGADKHRRMQEEISSKKQALKELKALKPLIPQNKGDEFYTRLTALIRTYVEEYFHLKATSKTTDEFLKDLETHAIFPSESRGNFAKFLAIADQVKFAQGAASPEQCKKAYDLAMSLIQTS